MKEFIKGLILFILFPVIYLYSLMLFVLIVIYIMSIQSKNRGYKETKIYKHFIKVGELYDL